MQDGVAQGAWDPHSADAFACGVDADVVVFDARTASRAQTIEKAHAQQTRDVRYNPNKPHEMMSCGDDGLLKMWDARAHERPLKVVAGHEHWIWNCAYNARQSATPGWTQPAMTSRGVRAGIRVVNSYPMVPTCRATSSTGKPCPHRTTSSPTSTPGRSVTSMIKMGVYK